MSDTLLVARKLAVGIAGLTFCRDFDLAVDAGQCWALLGRNGTGKTTLLHTLAGLRPPQSGHIELMGKPLASMNRRAIARTLALLPQHAPDPFPAMVGEIALMGRHPHLGRWQGESAADRRIAAQALEAMELTGMQARPVGTLSGGERRRLSMATVLAQDPRIALLDEPLNHLDLHHQIRVLQMVRSLARTQGKAFVLSLHDPNLALRYCDRALLLFGDSTITAGEAPALLNATNLSRLYGHPIRAVATERGDLFVPE